MNAIIETSDIFVERSKLIAHSTRRQRSWAKVSAFVCFPSSTYIFSRYPSSFDVVPLAISLSAAQNRFSFLSHVEIDSKEAYIYVVLFLRWNFNELKLFKTLSSSWDAYKVCNPTTSNMHNKREVGSRLARVLGKAAMAMKKKANFLMALRAGREGREELGQIKVQAVQHKSFRKLKHDVSSHKKIEECEAIEHRAREGRVGGSMEKRHKNN